jgi:hypothetical protein
MSLCAPTQGVEAVLTILQDCYGFSYPGGLFLAAVDVMLEKSPVVRSVKQQLQRCIGKLRMQSAWHHATIHAHMQDALVLHVGVCMHHQVT